MGYVWCEIRQQSSEEPCDETSFGNKNSKIQKKNMFFDFFYFLNFDFFELLFSFFEFVLQYIFLNCKWQNQKN